LLSQGRGRGGGRRGGEAPEQGGGGKNPTAAGGGGGGGGGGGLLDALLLEGAMRGSARPVCVSEEGREGGGEG